MRKISLITIALGMVVSCTAKGKEVKVVSSLKFYARVGWYVAGSHIMHAASPNHSPVPKFQLDTKKYAELKKGLDILPIPAPPPGFRFKVRNLNQLFRELSRPRTAAINTGQHITVEVTR